MFTAGCLTDSTHLIILSIVMKRKGVIFSHLQTFKKSKFPQFIKEILISTGFDTAISLQSIRKATIEELERIITNNTDLLKNTEYLNETGNLKKTPFKFMLGHETLILNLPNDVKEYLTRNKKQKEKEIPQIDELKLMFIERIKNFLRDHNINLTQNTEDLTKFEITGKVVKCAVKCPLCSNKVNCMFNSTWKISNYCKHIKSCVKKVETQRQIKRSVPAVVLRELESALP